MRDRYEVEKMAKKFDIAGKNAFLNSIEKWLKEDAKYEYYAKNKEEVIERIYNNEKLANTYDLPIVWYNGFATDKEMERYIF